MDIKSNREIIRRGKDNVVICLLASFPLTLVSLYTQCYYFLIHPFLCFVIAGLNFYAIDCYTKGKKTRFRL